MHHHRAYASFPTTLLCHNGAKYGGSVFGCVSWCSAEAKSSIVCQQWENQLPKKALSIDNCILYIHGFPDSSVDARMKPYYVHKTDTEKDETKNQRQLLLSAPSFSSRMPQKLEKEFILSACNSSNNNKNNQQQMGKGEERDNEKEIEYHPGEEYAPYALLSVNLSGTPGSSEQLCFHDKTVSQEVEDVLTLLDYLDNDEGWLKARKVHVVGLSTGAIIGGVLRGRYENFKSEHKILKSISIIASCGALGMEKALGYDFDAAQLAAFDADGACDKEFWVPENESLFDPTTHDLIDIKKERYRKTSFPLGCGYRDDFLSLDVATHLAHGTTPLLIIHGEEDKSIPIEEGRAVAACASEPMEFVAIPKGNHLLSSDKPMKAALRKIREWVTKHAE